MKENESWELLLVSLWAEKRAKVYVAVTSPRTVMMLLLPPIDGIWEPKERCTSARGKVRNVKNSFRGNQSDVEPMDDFIVSATVAHSIISLSRGRARARISQQNRRPLRTQAAITH